MFAGASFAFGQPVDRALSALAGTDRGPSYLPEGAGNDRRRPRLDPQFVGAMIRIASPILGSSYAPCSQSALR